MKTELKQYERLKRYELFAGFSTTVFVNYEEREDDGIDPILCFVSHKVNNDEKAFPTDY